jgi:hypothetical protein
VVLVHHLLQEQQKNMMAQLGQQSWIFKYSKIWLLAGCGLQTAALAFGGFISPPAIQEQQKNMMDQVGLQVLQV